MDQLTDWNAVAKFYDRFRQCDDGGIAEGASDAIGQLLAREQPDVETLARSMRSRRGMRHFILRHVDATLSDDDLRVIADQLPGRCDARNGRLCQALSSAARRALLE